MTLYTIHHHYIEGKYGYEASQLTRMRFAQIYEIPYEHLITAPQENGWQNRFVNMGFNYGTYGIYPNGFSKKRGYEFRALKLIIKQVKPLLITVVGHF